MDDATERFNIFPRINKPAGFMGSKCDHTNSEGEPIAEHAELRIFAQS